MALVVGADGRKDQGGCHFGLYSQRVAEELNANDPDPLALVNSSQSDDGIEMLTLKPLVVSAIRSHAFSK